jgi:hypothetical protein
MDKDTKAAVEHTVKCTLTTLGFDITDPISAQADMSFLRSARRLTGLAGTKAIMVIVGVCSIAIAGGILVAVGKAVKNMVS